MVGLIDGMGNQLNQIATKDYDPGVRQMYFSHPRDLPLITFQTIRVMLLDETIRLGLAMRSAPLLSCEFAYKEGKNWITGVKAKNPKVKEYVEKQLERIWSNGVEKMLDAQTWGWSAGEIITERDLP